MGRVLIMTDLRKPAPGVSPLRTSLTTSLPQRDASSREFSFSSADFERVRKLIYQHAGISLSPVKQDMVYSRLARRLRATGKMSFAEYLDALERNGGDEWERFVN
jgi:chemotaxis protein methyltransferase CheR